jgi:hypothetical protein
MMDDLCDDVPLDIRTCTSWSISAHPYLMMDDLCDDVPHGLSQLTPI